MQHFIQGTEVTQAHVTNMMRVVLIPPHADNNMGHPDCKHGKITEVTPVGIWVTFAGKEEQERAPVLDLRWEV